MKRDLDRLAREPFDLLIVGGGINGLCAALDAAQRGLRTALVEKQDFGGATSSGSYKILHGGLRYLQHLNVKRMRSSIRERRFMMQAAPHLVRPLPFLVPCKGHGMKSPEAMHLALWLNDLVSFDRNRGLDPSVELPGGRILSNSELAELAPFLPREGSRGAALFYDGQMLHSERFNIAFAVTAAKAGACLSNYTELVDFRIEKGSVTGAHLRDCVSGKEMTLSCRSVLNLAGPWNNDIIHKLTGIAAEQPVRFSKGIQLFTQGAVSSTGFTFESQAFDSTAVISRGARLYFGTPYRDTTFWGTTDTVYEGHPDDFTISQTDADGFLEEINRALPSLDLNREDIVGACGGLRPLDPATGAAANKTEIIHHQLKNRLRGMITGRGIKYTTCREFAESLVDLIFRQLNQPVSRPVTARTRLEGAPEGTLEEVLASMNSLPLRETTRLRLVQHYGSRAKQVAEDPRDLSDGREDLLAGEVKYAVTNEMALHLDDVLLRRSSAGNPGRPHPETAKHTADLMARLLHWDAARVESEMDRVNQAYPAWLNAPAPPATGPAGQTPG